MRLRLRLILTCVAMIPLSAPAYGQREPEKEKSVAIEELLSHIGRHFNAIRTAELMLESKTEILEGRDAPRLAEHEQVAVTFDRENRRIRVQRRRLPFPGGPPEEKLEPEEQVCSLKDRQYWHVSVEPQTGQAAAVASRLTIDAAAWGTFLASSHFSVLLGYLPTAQGERELVRLLQKAAVRAADTQAGNPSIISLTATLPKVGLELLLDRTCDYMPRKMVLTSQGPDGLLHYSQYVYEVHEVHTDGQTHFPSRFSIVTTSQGDAQGLRRVFRKQFQVQSVRLNPPLEDKQFVLQTTIPEGMAVVMYDAPQLVHRWQGGKVVRLADAQVVLAQPPAAFKPPSPARPYWVWVNMGLLALIGLLVALRWAKQWMAPPRRPGG